MVKLEKDRQILLDYRYFASFLLFYDIDLAYILYQGVARLMNVTTLHETWLTTQYGNWKFEKIREIKLVMSYEELKKLPQMSKRIILRHFK